MMSDATPTEIRFKESAIIDNHAVLVVESIGANIKRKVGSTDRTTWATLKSPQDKELRVAIPLHAGAGERPADTVSLVEVHDLAAEIMRSLEWALDDLQAPAPEW